MALKTQWGNFDIHSERNILFGNEMKRYEKLLRPKGWAKKIFQSVHLNKIYFIFFSSVYVRLYAY